MSEIESAETENLISDAESHGEVAESLEIDISFRIIRQFSKQLYDNPRRAIEELVCNSYDANATECHIYTPDSTDDSLYVLDNGHSMDLDGLEWLWKVASSPKQEKLGEQREKGNRQQIGKFGVGKLASFALGSRLTYVATKNGKTRVVSVHQDRLKDSVDDTDFDVYEMASSEAEELLGGYFEKVPNPWDQGWDNWTLATVSDIPEDNTGNNLQPWHLKNMIQTAIPTSTNFTSYLNGEQIEDRSPHGELVFSVDITEDEMIQRIEDTLKSYWASKKDIEREDVDEGLYEVTRTTFPNPENTTETVAGIEVPVLGTVNGQGKFFDRPVTTDKRRERGFQDHGFHIFVRGKLVNKTDPLFGSEPLSFTSWSRFIGNFEMPGLDDVIRVQRDQLMDEPEVHIARRVAKQTFKEVRSRKRAREDDNERSVSPSGGTEPKSLSRTFSERLQDRSKEYAYDAVNGLREDGAEEDIDLDSVEISTRPLNPTDRAVEYNPEENEISINEEHPLFDTLQQQNDFTKNIEDAFKEILAARLLIYGYLRSNGANRLALGASRQIFDSVLRSAAGSLGADELDYQLSELNEASTVGGTRFENAIVDIFQNIGLSAAQEGGPDTHDGVIEIFQAGPNYRVSIEAKGSQGVISNSDVGFDDVNRHRKEQDCDHAVVVAREFQADGINDKKSALLRNLDPDISDESSNNISLLTTDAIKVFLHLHETKSFTYSETIEILTNDRVPGEISNKVIEVWEAKPDDQLTRDILEASHDFMKEDPTNNPSIGALTADERLRGTKRNEIKERLEALDNLTNSVDLIGGNEIEIDASVEAILDEVDDLEIKAGDALETVDY